MTKNTVEQFITLRDLDNYGVMNEYCIKQF